ncbi:hypothetical protein M569_04226, partial [Genlisea aurea]
ATPATGHREATPATGHLEAATTAPFEHHRRLLLQERRVLSSLDASRSCKDGFEPLISMNALHQLHIFIFFLAVFHVFYGALTMTLGRLKIRGWKEWERQIIQETDANDPSRFRLTHETSFVKTHTISLMQNPILLYIVSFFRHILYSVQRPDYFTLRHGFVSVHLSPGTKFDFQKYIKRSLEDDFKVVVGIPPHLWMVTVIYLLLNVKGGVAMFWLSIFPLVLILAVGTKLQSIIARMAIEIQEKHAVVQGIPLVQVSDEHFWFSKPTLVLHLIHLVLFQNAFELTYFFWIWYEFGLHSCFHRNFSLVIVRIIIGVGIQFLCSYITLPLYALVTQMGSHMKKSIFDEQTSKALKSWHNKAKKKDRPIPQTKKLGSPDGSPGFSPRRTVVDEVRRILSEVGIFRRDRWRKAKEMMRIRFRSWLIFVLEIFVFFSTVSADLVISKLDRRIDLSSQVVRTTVSLKAYNDGPEAISEFLLPFSDLQAQNLSVLSATIADGRGRAKAFSSDSLPVHIENPKGGGPPSLTWYSVTLPKELANGGRVNLEINAVLTNVLKPFPEKITQNQFQLIVFRDSADFLSPYEVQTQSLAVVLPEPKVESYTKLENTKFSGSEIKYGPYANRPPFSYTPIVIHYVCNKPFAVAREAVREIEVSHWGNVQITENYNLIHAGAEIVGEFS